MAYACELINGLKMVTEIIFDKSTSAVNMRLTGPTEAYLSYFHHALSIIVNLWSDSYHHIHIDTIMKINKKLLKKLSFFTIKDLESPLQVVEEVRRGCLLVFRFRIRQIGLDRYIFCFFLMTLMTWIIGFPKKR